MAEAHEIDVSMVADSDLADAIALALKTPAEATYLIDGDEAVAAIVPPHVAQQWEYQMERARRYQRRTVRLPIPGGQV